MKMNKKGFTLIELLAVIVILAVIALIASPIILGIINDTQEAARIRSVEAYIKAIENTASSYMTTNPNASISICTGAGTEPAEGATYAPPNTCIIDATVAANNAKENGGTNTLGIVKYVKYSGSAVSCESAVYAPNNGTVTVTKCSVGGDTTTYSGSLKTGVAKVS